MRINFCILSVIQLTRIDNIFVRTAPSIIHTALYRLFSPRKKFSRDFHGDENATFPALWRPSRAIPEPVKDDFRETA